MHYQLLFVYFSVFSNEILKKIIESFGFTKAWLNNGEWYEVAHYKRVFVLSQNERATASVHFANGIQQIRKMLGNLGVDVVSNFDSPPINYYKFNIKFLVEEEDYRYNNKKQI